MGFFDGLGKFMRGEPVFEDNGAREVAADDKRATPQAKAPVQDPTRTSVDAHGRKIIPKFEVSRLKTTRNGDQMTSELWIQNESDETIRIDTIEVAGQKQVFNRQLGPHAGYQFVIYRGPVQRDESRHRAVIIYRLVRSDDLFEEEYFVEYNRESDGMYTLEEFHTDGPTRDI